MSQKKKKKSLYGRMVIIAVVPVLIISAIITVVCFFRFQNTLYNQTRDELHDIAGAVIFTYDLAYPGDYELVQRTDGLYDLYKGETNVTGDYEIVDTLSAQCNVEITLFYMDMRVNTTLLSEDRNRLAGTYANADTTARVITGGEEAFYQNINIGGENYLVLYKPINNFDGSVVGMIEVARTTSQITHGVWQSVWPILILAVLGCGIAIFFSYRNTKEIITVLQKLQTFMKKVAEGNLNADLDASVVRRQDELGDMTRSSVSMQKSIRSFIETDPLTQIGNRRYLLGTLSKIMERSKETGEKFALAIADIDFFKKVNDTYGHNAGDEVLKAVAGVLKKNMQGNGIAARWGGEEFIIVYDRCDKEAAVAHIEAILEEIRAMTVEADGFSIRVTMTFGVTDGKIADSETLIEQADELLYYGKQHGRNQIVSSLPEWEV